MSYNTRRAADGIQSVGARRNQTPIGNNFVSGGQLAQNAVGGQQQQQQRNNAPGQQGFGGAGNQNYNKPLVQQQPQQKPQVQQQRQIAQKPAQQQQPQQAVQQQQQQKPAASFPVQQQQQQKPAANFPAQQQALKAEPSADERMAVDGAPDSNNGGEAVQGGKRPFWATKGLVKINKKEKQRRRNMRLSRLLQPKNAVMILHELIKDVEYVVNDVPITNGNDLKQLHYTASVVIDGINHGGYGRSKTEAKNMAAEAALKHIVKNRQTLTKQRQEQQQDSLDGDVSMETDEEASLPWQHVASFAMFKLLSSWGEDLHSFSGGALGQPASSGGQQQQQSANQMKPHVHRPSKVMPPNASQLHPLVLINQMLPQARFEDFVQTGLPPAINFTCKLTIDSQSFSGKGTSKKAAKKMAAFAACNKVLGVVYPLELYAPTA